VKSYGASTVFDYASAGSADAVRTYTNNRLRYALDCITDEESVAFCYTALGRAGGWYSCLELCHENLQTRRAVKADFVMGLEVFRLKVDLSDGYEQDAKSEEI
jgi:NADPH:quinone reductase-like Zn-dependent oxidoreductase